MGPIHLFEKNTKQKDEKFSGGYPVLITNYFGLSSKMGRFIRCKF